MLLVALFLYGIAFLHIPIASNVLRTYTVLNRFAMAVLLSERGKASTSMNTAIRVDGVGAIRVILSLLCRARVRNQY